MIAEKVDKDTFLALHVGWVTVEDAGGKWKIRRAIPDGSLYVVDPDGNRFIITASNIAKEAIEAAKTAKTE